MTTRKQLYKEAQNLKKDSGKCVPLSKLKKSELQKYINNNTNTNTIDITKKKDIKKEVKKDKERIKKLEPLDVIKENLEKKEFEKNRKIRDITREKEKKKSNEDYKIGSKLDTLEINKLLLLTDTILCDIDPKKNMKIETVKQLKKYNIKNLIKFKKMVLSRIKSEYKYDEKNIFKNDSSCFKIRFRQLYDYLDKINSDGEEKDYGKITKKLTKLQQKRSDLAIKNDHFSLYKGQHLNKYKLGIIKNDILSKITYDKVNKEIRKDFDKEREKYRNRVIKKKVKKVVKKKVKEKKVIKSKYNDEEEQIINKAINNMKKNKAVDFIKSHLYNEAKRRFENK